MRARVRVSKCDQLAGGAGEASNHRVKFSRHGWRRRPRHHDHRGAAAAGGHVGSNAFADDREGGVKVVVENEDSLDLARVIVVESRSHVLGRVHVEAAHRTDHCDGRQLRKTMVATSRRVRSRTLLEKRTTQPEMVPHCCREQPQPQQDSYIFHAPPPWAAQTAISATSWNRSFLCC